MTALLESLTLAVTLVAIAGLCLCTCPNRSKKHPLTALRRVHHKIETRQK